MLFYTDKKGKVILHKDVYKIVPSFKELTDDEMLYVILSTDYYSIYHQYPEKDRKRKSKRWVYGKDAIDPETSPKVRKAIDNYNAIQYDEKRHTLEVYRKKRTIFEIQFENELDPERASKLMKSISEIQKMIDSLHHEITTLMQTKEILQGDKEMSLIERMRQNKELSEIRETAFEKQANLILENNLEFSKDNVAS